MQNQNSRRVIYFFALIKFLIPFLFIHSPFELHRDEYLYLADARHLDWGYIEMPPMLALLGFISNLFSASVYAVYFWSSLFGALTLIIVGKIVIELKGSVYAVFIACLSFLTSAYLRINILFMPNFLDGFFWTLSCFHIIKFINSHQNKYLYWLGVCFGLGFLSKYTIVFFIIGFLVGVIILHRKLLLNKHFYFSMLLGILIASPNIYWQFYHHFPVMHHMQLLTSQQLQFSQRADFIKFQFFLFSSSVFIWLMGLWFLFTNQQGKKYAIIGVLYFIIIALLLLLKGKHYYAASIYPALVSIGSVYIGNLAVKYRIKIVQWLIPACMILVCVELVPVLLPVASPEQLEQYYRKINAGKMGLLDWEESKNNLLPQDFADMVGWKEVAEKTAVIYHQLPDCVKKQTMVYGDNYGEAGALTFYRKKLQLPEIYSDDASFVFWLPSKFDFKYFLFATRNMPEKDDLFFQHFKKVEIKDSVVNKYFRENRTKIVLYSFPDDTARMIAVHNIEKAKNDFNYH